MRREKENGGRSNEHQQRARLREERTKGRELLREKDVEKRGEVKR